MALDIESGLRAFELEREVVDALAGGAPATTSQERYKQWRTSLPDELQCTEYLLPRIVRHIELEEAPFMDRRGPAAERWKRRDLQLRLRELGPWRLPFRLGDLVTLKRTATRDRILFRRELINGTLQTLLGPALGETTVLDLGCNAGFFSLDMAHRGAREVTGIDLRQENIAQAQFLAEYYGIDNASFSVLDVDDVPTDRQWDVVLNLGVLYHVINPLQFLRRTYELCRRVAIIDTAAHKEPVSGYFLFRDKDVDIPTEGREAFEFHPTYRGAIDSIRCAGFSDVIEITGHCDPPHELYASGTRRCFLAIK